MYRPKKLDEFIGQEAVVNQVKILVDAAKKRAKPPPHILISGPGGTGKTTIAEIIATETGGTLIVTSPAALTNNQELFDLFNKSMGANKPALIVFLDEIHRISFKIEEDLYQPMENNFFVRKGVTERTFGMYPWTLIGATTLPGKLSEPFRTRFGVHLEMDTYTEEDMEVIILQAAEKENINIEGSAASEIAKRCRRNPRLANHLLDRCQDLTVSQNCNTVSAEIASGVFKLMGIDALGLTNTDRRYLATLYDAGRAVGVESLVPLLHTDADTIRNSIEPYLVQCGFVLLTPRGRTLSVRGEELVNMALDKKSTGLRMGV
jgi:holliday junction DNA helicase RuvB